MKRISCTYLFFLYACAADPFTASDNLSFPDVQNIDAQNSVDSPQENDSGNTLDQVVNSVDAGIDQLGTVEKDVNSESFVDAQTSETTEEMHDAGPCIPKTCLTLAVEASKVSACGLHFDGCGNYIQCPNCDVSSNAHTSCGGNNINADGSLTVGTPGFCGGGCLRSSLPVDASRCTVVSSKYIYPWVCSDISTNQPKGFGPGSCIELRNHEQAPFTTLTDKWCCLG